MNIVGIVAEYNPFHCGHLHHLQEAKRQTNASAAISVMGGNFLQRGEPALLNKWARARMALASGVDLVFELPFAYATRSANLFALGAVALLARTGLVTHLVFGSESGNLEELQAVADILEEEPPFFSRCLREELEKGRGFAAARATALRLYLKAENRGRPHLGGLLSQPNNILGIEYLRALKRLESRIQPVTIRRFGPAYHSNSLSGPQASASAIRAGLSGEPTPGNDLEGIRQMLPASSWDILRQEMESGRAPVTEQSLSQITLAILRRTTPEALRVTPDVETGLEQRIIASARETSTLAALVDQVTTKRYPASRIRRILVYLLVGLTRDMDASFHMAGGPQYLRLLGSSAGGRRILRLLRQSAALPVVHRPAVSRRQFSPAADQMLALDILATDLYVLLYPDHDRRAGLDFRQGPARVE